MITPLLLLGVAVFCIFQAHVRWIEREREREWEVERRERVRRFTEWSALTPDDRRWFIDRGYNPHDMEEAG